MGSGDEGAWRSTRLQEVTRVPQLQTSDTFQNEGVSTLRAGNRHLWEMGLDP